MKRTILYLFVAALFTGCVEEVLIEVEPADQKMVVSTLFIPDSILIVTLSRSFSALSARDIEDLGDDLISSLLVDQARVTITLNGQVDTLQKITPGIFVGSIGDANPLDLFELNVYDSTTNSSIRSITQLKQQVRFDEVSLTREAVNGDTVASIHYQFSDPEEQENWYLIQAFELPELPDLSFSIDENGEVVIEADTSNQFFFVPKVTPLFTDLISDLTQESNVISSTKELPSFPKDTLIFVMINIDQGYYDFLQARKRSGGIFASFTREPVNHPTNVENGYGYFTMHLPHFKAYIRED